MGNTVKFACPKCGQEYEIATAEIASGSLVACTCCGAEFSLPDASNIFSQTESASSVEPPVSASDFDLERTMPPQRHGMESASDVTMPGKRDRKPDGRFAAGDLIMGRYQVLAELGQGGMGVVYKCFDETAGIEIALKALPPELSHNTLEMEDIKDNFQLVHNLHHPNIASSNNLELDNSNGNYYLIMECVDGEDLRHWIKQKRKDGTLTLETVLPVISQVAAALDYAHRENIIHRDIKPGNIMINAAGDVKVLDFGLAAQIHTSMTRVSMAYQGTGGTGPYMAPEQWRGKAQGAAADQYALAVMTYEMLAGHLPFESTDVSVLREIVLNEPPEDIKDFSPAVNQALQRGLSKDPADRFDSCADFVAALSGEKSRIAGRRLGKISRMRVITAAIIFGIVAVVLGVLWFGHRPKTAQAGPAFQWQEEKMPAVISWVAASTSKKAVVTPKKVVDKSTLWQPGPLVGTLLLPGKVKLEMVKVEAGIFTMGRTDKYKYRFGHRERTVTLTKDFYIGKTEVTQAQWKAVMGTTLEDDLRYNIDKARPLAGTGDNYPMYYVSWNDAMDFCAKLNESGCAPPGWHFSLPTVTQWEFAARGGNLGKKHGYEYSGSNDIDAVAWFRENSKGKTHPVGTKAPNELGVYDMTGNVCEWCLDDDWIYIVPEFSSKKSDANGSSACISGGGYLDSGDDCITADSRHCTNDRDDRGRNYCTGFRLVLVPEKYK